MQFKTQKFVISGRLPGTNEYTKFCRTNKNYANAIKAKNEKKVIECLDGIEKVKHYPVKIKINWYEKNKKRDVDNISFGTKFINDALVKCGILENDGQKQIDELEHVFLTDKTNPRIEVFIIEKDL